MRGRGFFHDWPPACMLPTNLALVKGASVSPSASVAVDAVLGRPCAPVSGVGDGEAGDQADWADSRIGGFGRSPLPSPGGAGEPGGLATGTGRGSKGASWAADSAAAAAGIGGTTACRERLLVLAEAADSLGERRSRSGSMRGTGAAKSLLLRASEAVGLSASGPRRWLALVRRLARPTPTALTAAPPTVVVVVVGLYRRIEAGLALGLGEAEVSPGDTRARLLSCAKADKSATSARGERAARRAEEEEEEKVVAAGCAGPPAATAALGGRMCGRRLPDAPAGGSRACSLRRSGCERARCSGDRLSPPPTGMGRSSVLRTPRLSSRPPSAQGRRRALPRPAAAAAAACCRPASTAGAPSSSPM